MKKIFTIKDIEEGSKRFDEATKSIDFDNIDTKKMTFEELKEIITKGMYVIQIEKIVCEFIDNCEKEGKTIDETIDKFFNMDISEEVKKINEPITLKDF